MMHPSRTTAQARVSRHDARENYRAVLSRVSARYERAPGERVVADARDISAGGMFLRATTPLSVGALVPLELRVVGEHRSFSAVGRVVWTREVEAGEDAPSGMGLEFVDLGEGTLEVVRRLVSRRQPTLPGIGSVPPPARARIQKLLGLAVDDVAIPASSPPPSFDRDPGYRKEMASVPLHLVTPREQSQPLYLVTRKRSSAPAPGSSDVPPVSDVYAKLEAPPREEGPASTQDAFVLEPHTATSGGGILPGMLPRLLLAAGVVAMTSLRNDVPRHPSFGGEPDVASIALPRVPAPASAFAVPMPAPPARRHAATKL
jgi:uncharacterized protein (TIGR02266 family)